MSASPLVQPASRHVPRGLSKDGPLLFSYGFRPFFLGAGIWAVLTMAIWIASLTTTLPVGGSYQALNWHAHEMLFGFCSAVLAGFLLTAVPNWTGRLPVSGRPLMLLSGLWLCGRLALIWTDFIGLLPAVLIESLFLPALLFICAREIIAGKQWKNLLVLGGVTAVTLANLLFHYCVLFIGDIAMASRLAIAAYLMLIAVIGGRIIPSFTRNWLNKAGETRFPVPYNGYDRCCLALSAATLLGWTLLPEQPVVACLALICALAHLIRLGRWRGLATGPEKLLFILHIAYGFMPLSFVMIAANIAGYLNIYSAMHVMTVGAIALMMLAVMGRATRGHTGNELVASPLTSLSYLCLVGSALLRPFAEIEPAFFHTILALSALLWMSAFSLFVIEYAPMQLGGRKPRQPG